MDTEKVGPDSFDPASELEFDDLPIFVGMIEFHQYRVSLVRFYELLVAQKLSSNLSDAKTDATPKQNCP